MGGKGLSLARMMAAEFPVPAGFTVTTAAYRQFVSDNDLQQAIIDQAKPELVGTAVSFDSASQQIQALFAKNNLGDAQKAQIADAYAALGDGEPPVAVRSSANAEDLPDLSFAGQQDTYLNIRGSDSVFEAVRDCWASLWTARALSYRYEHAIAQQAVDMAVVVQEMVPSEVSGVLFTANPATGERSEWNPTGAQDSEMDRLMEVAQSATTLEEYHRLMREANQYATAQHWILWGGRVPQFNVHQPWIKGYNGETDLGDMDRTMMFSRLWIDQELKKEMGF